MYPFRFLKPIVQNDSVFLGVTPIFDGIMDTIFNEEIKDETTLDSE